MSVARATAWAAGAGLAVGAAPSLVSLGPVRSALTPTVLRAELSGISSRRRVALTYDDGPDTTSTPAFLRRLDALGVTATFFVLGRHLGDRSLLHEMVAAGHQLGVHGWDHRPVLLLGPRTLRDALVRTRDLVEDATGTAVRFYRPPYGVCTPAARWAARQAGLRTILWSAWGRDWERGATPSSVTELVTAQLRPGGTVLLHDSDRTSAPGSWRTTLVATDRLVRSWQSQGLDVGGLDSHWTESAASGADPCQAAVRTPRSAFPA